jgi:hypothetical protein
MRQVYYYPVSGAELRVRFCEAYCPPAKGDSRLRRTSPTGRSINKRRQGVAHIERWAIALFQEGSCSPQISNRPNTRFQHLLTSARFLNSILLTIHRRT